MRFRQADSHLLLVTGTIEVLVGLAVLLLPRTLLPVGGFFGVMVPAQASLVLLVSSACAFLGLRYPVGTWWRRLIALPVVLPMPVLVMGAGPVGEPFAIASWGVLGAAVLAAEWLPVAGTGSDPAVRLANATLAVSELILGAMFLTHPAAVPPSGSPAVHAATALLNGLAGAVGAAALLLPDRDGRWLGGRGRRRLLAMAAPLLSAVGATLVGAPEGMALWLVWMLYVLGGPDRVTGILGRAVGPRASGPAMDPAHMERTVESWCWLLVLAVVGLSLVRGAARTPPASLHVFVLVVILYNVVAFWVLPDRGRAEHRIVWHLRFLMVALAFVMLIGGAVTHGVMALLVVLPIVGARAAGDLAGARLARLSLLLVLAADLLRWPVDGFPLDRVVAGAVADVLVLGAVSLVLARGEEARRHAQHALRQSEARFRAVHHGAVVGIVLTDESERIFYWNRAAQQIFGPAGGDVAGRGVAELLTDWGRPPGSDGPAGEAGAREMHGRRQDGRETWLEMVRSEWQDTGEDRFRVHVFRDVTERHQAQAEIERLRRRYELILNSAGEGICGLDAQGLTAFVNPVALRLLGREAGDLVGRLQHDLIHHSHPDGSPYPVEECHIYRALMAGESHHASDEVFWRQDGTSFPVEYVSTPIVEEGEIVGSVLTFNDISERRAVERMKNEFVSVVSHELRTPLTSIRGALGLLAGGIVGTLPEKGRRMLEIAVGNTDRLIRLINDILDVERMESGRVQLSLQLCDAAALMQQAAEVVRPVAQRAEVALDVEPLPAVLRADPDRIVQTLTNLLANAVKFSPAGGHVRLSAARVDGCVRFEVVDQGRGIPADKLETIFERFQQVDASDSREKGGTGLGLAICRTIVSQHGGRIWAESETGRGSRLCFTLPVPAAVEAPATGGEPSPAAEPFPDDEDGRPAVVVCDDEADVRSVVGAMLENHGYCPLLAASGEEALALVARRHPDALLLDLMMPGMTGWDVLARLRADPAAPKVPVVILSALRPDGRSEHEVAVSDWVTKPVDEVRLFEALAKAVGQRSRTPRVLVVEDDPDLGRVLAAIFERHGVETHLAETGEAAIRLSQRIAPDLLVLDLVLAEGDGFTVVDWLRHHDRLGSVPLVVYSARDLDPSERSRLRLGPTEFLTKGRVSPDEFERRVVGLLDHIMVIRRGGAGVGSQAGPGGR